MKDVGISDPKVTNSKNIFKGLVKSKTRSHFSKLNETLIDVQRPHSLRAFPHFKNKGKPQDYLPHPNVQNVIMSFRLGDAGLGNRAMNPVKQCPVCKNFSMHGGSSPQG